MNDRRTSGTAEQLASDRDPTNSASMRRMPSVASAGTMVRDPASGSPVDPASSTTTVRSERMTVQDPRPTASESTTTSPGRMAVAAEHGAPETMDAAIATPIAAHDHRQARRGWIQATTTATRSAAHHHHPTRPVAATAPGASAAACAIHASERTHSTATEPNSRPASPTNGRVAMESAPPIVAIAAAGMVTTLSGAASHEMLPACRSAIGVLTLQATSAATMDERSAEIAISGTSGTFFAPTHAFHAVAARRCQRAVTTGATVSSATTTP